jgi:hypothetical protein
MALSEKIERDGGGSGVRNGRGACRRGCRGEGPSRRPRPYRGGRAAVHVVSRGKSGSDMQALVVSRSEGVSQVGRLRRFK